MHYAKQPRRILLGFGSLLIFLLDIIPASAFDSFEHRYLGNTTFEIVSREMADKKAPWSDISLPPVANSDQRDSDRRMAINFLKEKNVPVGFGDLPALAGDFTDTVKDLREKFEGFLMLRSDESTSNDVKSDVVKMILAIRRQWFNACRWFRERIPNVNQRRMLDRCFSEITSKEQLDQFIAKSDSQGASPVSTGYLPTRIEESEFEQIPGFVGLASTNKTHFPQHSWDVYIRHHYCALVFAAASERKSVSIDEEICSPIGDSELTKNLPPSQVLWYQAMIYEGFAHHFLHDSFSSGHIGVPYGRCTPWVKLFCRPTKQVLQHTHDTLNRIGLRVVVAQPPKLLEPHQEMLKTGWTAFGDDQLLTPEASFHLAVVLRVAVESLKEVYEVRTAKLETHRVLTLAETCERWSRVFPIPEVEDGLDRRYNCAPNASPKDLWEWSGRSADERVPDPVLEGWKILVTYGTSFGNFDQLNADGTIREQNRNFDTFTFEMGYVRSTGWNPWPISFWPNYIGFGFSILPEIRTSIYPLSFGWWYIPKSRSWFLGLRNNWGVRLEEGLTEENRDDRLRAQVEASIVIDAGWEIYSPVALYLRIEPFTLVARGLGSGAQSNQITVESFFNGRGAITAGLRFDLANVY
jgi:hypothetical protein